MSPRLHDVGITITAHAHTDGDTWPCPAGHRALLGPIRPPQSTRWSHGPEQALEIHASDPVHLPEIPQVVQAGGHAPSIAPPPPACHPSQTHLASVPSRQWPRTTLGYHREITPPVTRDPPAMDQRTPINQELRLRVHSAEPETHHVSPHFLEVAELLSLSSPSVCAMGKQLLPPLPLPGLILRSPLNPPPPPQEPGGGSGPIVLPGLQAGLASPEVCGSWARALLGPPPGSRTRGAGKPEASSRARACGSAASPCLLPAGVSASQADGVTPQHEPASWRNAAFDARTDRHKGPAPPAVKRRQLGP